MKQIFRLAVTGAAVLAGGWVLLRTIPYIAPFLVSFGAAWLMEPAVSALQVRGVSRAVGAGVMTAMVLVLTAGLVGSCAIGGARLVSGYAQKAPDLLAALEQAAEGVRGKFLLVLQSAPDGLERELITAADEVSRQLSQLPAVVSRKALTGMTALAKHSSGWLLFVCTAIIGIYFFSLYYGDIRSFAGRQLSPQVKSRLRLIRAVTVGAVAGYLKVQCIISGVTFLILLGAFRLMGIEDGPMAALGIAVIDALPVLGSGAVLIPWALIALAVGKVSRGMGLCLVYGVLLVTHNLLQTKLMGSHLGLHPVTALVSLYVGWKLAGIGGMLLLPIVCVLLTALNDGGILHLYK